MAQHAKLSRIAEKRASKQKQKKTNKQSHILLELPADFVKATEKLRLK